MCKIKMILDILDICFFILIKKHTLNRFFSRKYRWAEIAEVLCAVKDKEYNFVFHQELTRRLDWKILADGAGIPSALIVAFFLIRSQPLKNVALKKEESLEIQIDLRFDDASLLRKVYISHK